ncbi:MAG: uracil phosphoribosyltransferase [Verrucomicrobiota bacterium]|nr:uracil phosphoribosyltransferase [Verrucomicrobiota bacterium]
MTKSPLTASSGMHASEPSSSAVQVLDHPFGAVQLSLLRSKTTRPNEFRQALQKLALLLLVEAARRWEIEEITLESPLRSFRGAAFRRPVALIPILRAGLGLQEGMMPLLPEASTGHVGLYRDPKTLRPVKYYSRLPANLSEAEVLVLDPMLATGHSAAEAVSIVKAAGATRLQFICVLACPPGVAALQQAHPDVPIIAAAVDPELNEVGYIVPGLGDAGDRYFGTL